MWIKQSCIFSTIALLASLAGCDGGGGEGGPAGNLGANAGPLSSAPPPPPTINAPPPPPPAPAPAPIPTAPSITMQPPPTVSSDPLEGDESFDMFPDQRPTITVTLPAERPIPPGADPEAVARAFMDRTGEEEIGLLTAKAQQVRVRQMEQGVTFEQGPGSYEIRNVSIDGDEAEVEMIHTDPQTRRSEPGGVLLRREDGEWCVYGIKMAETAEHPEMTMSFEQEDGPFGALAGFAEEMNNLPEAMLEGGGFGAERADPEQRASTFEAIEAVDPDEFRSSWTVDLALNGRPAGEAIAELASPIGLELDRSRVPGDALDRPVTLSAEGLTRLEAIERVCEAAGLYATYGAPPGEGFLGSFEGDAVKPVPAPRPWPVGFAGPFLIEVLGVSQQPSGAGELQLRVLGLGLPAAIVELLKEDMFRMPDEELIMIDAVAGPGGEDLLPQGRSPSTMSSEGLPEGVYEVELSVPLAGLLRSVPAIAEVRGRLSLEVPTEVQTIRFDPLRPGAVQQSGDLTATIEGDRSRFQVKLEKRSADEDETIWARRIFLLGRDQDGRAIGGEFGGGMGDSREYTGFPSFDDFDAEPASLSLKFASTIERQPLEFRLGPIPLRDFARMPASVSSLDFSGHDAPVSAEFVRFLDDDRSAVGNSGPPYLIRLVNHSNKDIRRLVLDASFLDASGDPVGNAPPLNFDYDPFLVQKRDEREMKQSGFFVPRGAVSAEFQAREIGFIDGTSWDARAD